MSWKAPGTPKALQRTRTSSETGHGLHVSEDRVEETSASGETNFTDGDGESGGDVLELRVMGEGVLGLGHANYSCFRQIPLLKQMESTYWEARYSPGGCRYQPALEPSR